MSLTGSAPVNAAEARQPLAGRGRPERRLRRAALWGLLLALLAVAQTMLVTLTVRYETSKAQDAAESAANEAAAQVRRDLARLTQAVQGLSWLHGETAWRGAAEDMLKQHPELRRLETRDARFLSTQAADSPFPPELFVRMRRDELISETEIACQSAARTGAPVFSRSFYVPLQDGAGSEVVDLCVPLMREGRHVGSVIGSMALGALLENATSGPGTQRHEISFVETDGARVARAGPRRGAGVYTASMLLDLPGQPLMVRADGISGRPSLIPNIATALVLGLSIALFALVFMLARDVRRRAAAEQALAEALGFRKAMEDSLSTGLRARDLEGAITYVNPAFCAMVGYSAEELLAVKPPQAPPYWPPELAPHYAARQRTRLAASAEGRPGLLGAEAQEGYETLYVRRNGERFPVMLYEAPLLDGEGRHAGWMGSVLELTAQRRIEELSRQQQERLQAAARLATVGEMASLLSHELNQPLAAIASYAAGSLNLLEAGAWPAPEREPALAGAAASGARAPAVRPAPPLDPFADPSLPSLLRQVLERIAEQAERAGRIIKSVHGFVRRREQMRETIAVDLLIDSVMPLVRLQSRKSAARIEVQTPAPPARMPRVVCDRTMVEQLLLNLTRNAIQAVESLPADAPRLLVLRVKPVVEGRVTFEVADSGPGIAPEVAAQLFTPFFTTRSEGMGLGLSLCRTVVEQHGGTLGFEADGGTGGTCFRFTLPAAAAARDGFGAPLPAGAGAESRESGDTVGR